MNITQKRREWLGTVSMGAIALCLCTNPTNGQATFEGLGDLPGGVVFSRAYAVSADGSVVVGSSRGESGQEAFRWTRAEGMVGLNDQTSDIFASEAFGLSADGTYVVGYFREASNPVQIAFRWHQNTGMFRLGDETIRSSLVFGVTANGSTVVGYDSTTVASEALKWNSDSGFHFLGSGYNKSMARAITPDGTFIVGFGQSEVGIDAVRWSSDGNVLLLGDLPGGAFNSDANAISSDGSVVVGSSSIESFGVEAFRWTSQSGMIGLGDLPGQGILSQAFGVSGDGTIVVGQGTTQLGFEAILWDENNEIHNLKELLENQYGLDLSGWQPQFARGISADGRTIVGWGLNPDGNTEAWIATLPELAESCPADTNGDNSVNVTDLLAMLATWGPCPPPCPPDINQDGSVNVTDLLAILGAWGACP